METHPIADEYWGYEPGQPPTGSMTCAGISAVIMCSAQLNVGDAKIEEGRVRCCGEQLVDTTVERALAGWRATFRSIRIPGAATPGFITICTASNASAA